MSQFRVEVPLDTVCWQGICMHCHAQFALLHAEFEDAPRPVVCPFCAHMAVYSKPEVYQ